MVPSQNKIFLNNLSLQLFYFNFFLFIDFQDFYYSKSRLAYDFGCDRDAGDVGSLLSREKMKRFILNFSTSCRKTFTFPALFRVFFTIKMDEYQNRTSEISEL